MTKPDILAQALGAAITIRAYELLQGYELNGEQAKLYIENYDGNYPRKIVEAGFGILISLRLNKRKSLGKKLMAIFVAPAPPSDQERMIEEGANRLLAIPSAREEMEQKLRSGFRRPN